MAPGAEHRAGVEELVEAEPCGPGVGSLEGVAHGARRVAQAAREEEPDDRRPAGPPELGQPEQGRPAHDDVEHRVEHARRVHPQVAAGHLGDGAAPDERQQHRPGTAVQQQDGQGRVGAGDEDRDVRVVEAAQHRADPPRPVPAVVDGRVAEEHEAGEQVDRLADAPGQRVRDDDEREPGQQQQRGRDGVQPAAQAGFGLGGGRCTDDAGTGLQGHLLITWDHLTYRTVG